MTALTSEESDDLLNFMCGAKLGEGTYRTVFACHFDESLVIKRDNRGNFSNVHEFAMWCEFKGTPLEKWLAPCRMLSPGGIWLAQVRTEPIPKHMLPKSVPSVFADTKQSNWGIYDGRPVCHDYANNEIYNLAVGSGRPMKKAAWHNL